MNKFKEQCKEAREALGDRISLKGWTWTWDEGLGGYECRGSVYYDEENDECPDPALWDCARELVTKLKMLGIDCYRSSSEKGWVEVQIETAE